MPVAGLPERFENWKTIYNPASPLAGGRHWEMILGQLRAGFDRGAGQAWMVAVDTTVVRAHQHAAGARRRPPADVDPARVAVAELTAPRRPGAEPDYKNREGLGCSRGGLTSKIHLLADSGRRPLARVTSAGPRHDSLAFVPLMGQLRIARRGPAGRGSGRAGCWVTRPTPAARSGATCGSGGSRPPSPNLPIRYVTAASVAPTPAAPGVRACRPAAQHRRAGLQPASSAPRPGHQV